MEQQKYPESDWQLLHPKLSDWQETYMERPAGEYRVLSGDLMFHPNSFIYN
ncbi:MAG: hypothetical protein IJP92_16335 [Lachnospiraceae bacterium]|nr:hypothetical protein [Lachnospiraceae bacterium]